MYYCGRPARTSHAAAIDTQVHEVPLNQIVVAQLKVLQLIEGLDRKVALLATSKK
jgi:hypothetical protein